MTFGQPINFERFLSNHKFTPMTSKLMDPAALELTSHLVLQQEYISPVVLNMIVSALLLQSTQAKVKFSFIYAAARKIYDYLV